MILLHTEARFMKARPAPAAVEGRLIVARFWNRGLLLDEEKPWCRLLSSGVGADQCHDSFLKRHTEFPMLGLSHTPYVGMCHAR